MTRPVSMAAAVPPEEVPWPEGSTAVLRNRPVRGNTSTEMARFEDDRWPLTPAHPDAHSPTVTLRWDTYPPTLIRQFKAFVFAALDHPYPVAISGRKTLEQASCGTVKLWFLRLRAFAVWLDHRGIERLCEVDDGCLDSYLDHVRAVAASPGVGRQLLGAVRALWAYGAYLPAVCRLATGNPWRGVSPSLLARCPVPDRFNSTPRIASATMEALLDWSLRIVEDLGPDIRDAWALFQELDAGCHPDQRIYQGLAPRERLRLFADQIACTGGAFPGDPAMPGQVSHSHLGRLVGITPRRRARSLGGQAHSLACRLRLPIDDDCYVGAVTGSVNGLAWRDRPITVAELPLLVRVLVTACFVIVCYLTGARPGEVAALRRGCRGTDPTTGELVVHGRRGKGFDRTPFDADDAHQPWVTVQPVHEAIAMLESLHSRDLLFPADLLRNDARTADCARRTNELNKDMETLVSWVNDTFTSTGGDPPIPADPGKHLHGARFRRTLAYFIVRRPRGLIAAALQYAHVSTKVTLSYAGNDDASWMDDLAVEKLEMVLERGEQDWALLQAGEHVSGPSAQEYRTRVAKFAGRVVGSVRSAERLLAQTGPDIHHAEGMTCVHRAQSAACRQERRSLDLAAGDGPDESFCQSSCANLSYTDRDIDHIQRQLTAWEATESDPLVPRPLRDRATAQAAHARGVISAHEATRPRPDRDGEDR